MTDTESNSEKIQTQSKQKVSKAKQKAVAEKVQPAPANVAAAPATPVETKKSSNGLAVLATILSIGALAGVGFSWYQNQVVGVQQESGLAIGITEIGGQVSRIGDNVARLQQQQTEIVSQDKLDLEVQKITSEIEDKIIALNLDNRLSELSSQQVEVNQALVQLNNDLKSGVNAYALEEVSQLLKLANQNIVFARNPDNAASALSLADLQLQGLNDPRYSPVRVKIAEEISALESIDVVDTEGLSAKLTAIGNSIAALPLANEPETTNVNLSATPTQEGTGWRQEFSKLWDEIKSSIQVQRVDQPPKPLLAPEQRYFLDQNLQLMLNTAQLALVREQPGIFKTNIESARQWLQDYFDLTDSRVSDVVRELDDIGQQQLVFTLPEVTGSYQALQSIRGGQ